MNQVNLMFNGHVNVIGHIVHTSCLLPVISLIMISMLLWMVVWAQEAFLLNYWTCSISPVQQDLHFFRKRIVWKQVCCLPLHVILVYIHTMDWHMLYMYWGNNPSFPSRLVSLDQGNSSFALYWLESMKN